MCIIILALTTLKDRYSVQIRVKLMIKGAPISPGENMLATMIIIIIRTPGSGKSP